MAQPARDTQLHERAPQGGATRFVWPPRRLDQGVAEQTTKRMAEARLPAESGKEAARSDAGFESSPPVEASRAVRVWSQIERTWLDVTAPPLDERMAEEGWRPDALRDYCVRCAHALARHGGSEGLCEACRSGETARPPWNRIFRLGEYAPPLSRWVCEVKFTRWRRLGYDLGQLLGEAIAPELELARAQGEVPGGPPLIVPVPMSFWRRMIRGIDHTAVIAHGLAARLEGQVIQPLKRSHRPSQTRILPSARTANVANSIRPRGVRRGPALHGRLVIVVDDVATTTSTLRAACRAVRSSAATRTKGKPVAIWAAVLARTALDGHDSPQDG